MFRNCDIAGCEIQTGHMGTPPNRSSLLNGSNSLPNLWKVQISLPLPPGKDFFVEFHASWTPKSGQMPWGIVDGGHILN